MRVVTSDSTGCLIECTGEFEGRITSAGLLTVFPHAMEDKVVFHRVCCRRFLCPTRTLITLDANGCMVQYDAYSDVFKAMSELLDFNPIQVVKLMDDAMIGEEGSMLPPVDDDEFKESSGRTRSESSNSSPSRSSIDFILS
ncbi:unnamed protein product [Phytophthora lilii]|uniref:Unnamed protein product n=1 Tax=Phytophthora lilii TaxID=2077276 RepID=A0A9W6YJ45_9STRA|nr:unnamed protein product [Phytophthora lilii]